MGSLCVDCRVPVETRRGTRCAECKKVADRERQHNRWASMPEEQKQKVLLRNRTHIQSLRKYKAYREKEKVFRRGHKKTHVYKFRQLDYQRAGLLYGRVTREMVGKDSTLPPDTSKIAILWKIRDTSEKFEPLRIIICPLPTSRPTPNGWSHLVYAEKASDRWVFSRHVLTRESDLRLALYLTNKLKRWSQKEEFSDEFTVTD